MSPARKNTWKRIFVGTHPSLKSWQPHFKSCDAFRDRSTHRNATSEILGEDAPGSSHMSIHIEELKILSVYGKGEGPLATDGHDTLFTASEVEALNSLSADHSVAKSLERGERLVCREELSVQQQTPDTISIKVEEDTGGGLPTVEDCDAVGDRSTERNATSEILVVDAPGSSHMSSHSEELKILSVYGKGEGPLAEDGHDTLFTASEGEVLNSLSADHSVAKSLERGERLVCREELSMQQQTPDAISIKVEEDIGGGLPAVEDCDAFGDRSTQLGATSEILGVDAPGSSRMSSRSKELVQQTPDTISIKVEEDIGGGMPAVEDGNDIRDCSTQRGATSESLRVDAPGSSHMSSHSGELRILSVYGQGEGPLAVDGHNALFAASELEALSSLSKDHSVATSLNCSVQLVRLEELTGHQGGRKGRPGVLCGKVIPNNANMIVHMRTHSGENPYKCDQCTKGFSLKRHLKSHMRTHSGEKPYKCDQCTKRYRRTSHLKRHIMTHSGERPFRCDQCTKGFSLKCDLNIHMRTHSGVKPYMCDHCTKSYSQTSHLKIHMRTHSGEKPYKCDQCTKRFSLTSYLKIHMRTHDKPYRCDQCTKRFSLTSHLKSHMSTHSGAKPYRCDQCTMRFSRTSSLKIHMRTHSGEKPYKCDQCTKSFSQKVYLKSHLRTHSGEKPYKCDQCMKCFGHKGTLKHHMMTHSGEKPYRCDQCTKRFSQTSQLKVHMRTHSGVKPYKCDQCTKGFSLKSHLRGHLSTHSGEKPYRCDQCTKCFSLKYILKRHMMTHSGEKPYKCDQCKKCFSLKGPLRHHMRTHSGEKPYKCDQCTKGFILKGPLMVHMRTHSGEKPYKCDQCKMRFSQKGTLKIHMRTHSGEKPYKCDQCTMRFSQIGGLKIHLRTHSG
ncbi:zinc finger protein 431-like isoform X2 [Gadus macrocephalus]|uniref:zinc finger protein 431-like isoform X2 n=1 Tax=Gadus macrocephalus TaxID=80720 RepID=UPI0028CBA00D|nr:zinc finger protein 431-like isoform X2 [Gadus macrocephalus]